jgi:adenylate cyclase
LTKERIFEALKLLEQAIERDPRYGPALALAAICYLHFDLNGWSDHAQTNRRQGVDRARQALQVTGDDPGSLTNTAFVLAYFGEDIGAMIALVDRSLALNPSFARGWYMSGTLRVWAGQPDIAIEHVETSLRLSLRDRMGSHLFWTGAANFLDGRFDDAAAKLLVAIQEHPGDPEGYRFLAACYAHMARLDDAREIVARLRTLTSVVIPSATYLRKVEQRELLLSGLRLAAGQAA